MNTQMDPRTCLERLLDPKLERSTPARDGGDLTEVDSASEALWQWLERGGYCPECSEDELHVLRKHVVDALTYATPPGRDSTVKTDQGKAGQHGLALRLARLVRRLETGAVAS